MQAKLDNHWVHRNDSVPWEKRFGAALSTNYTRQVNRYPLSTSSSWMPPKSLRVLSTHSRDIRLLPVDAGTESVRADHF